MNHLAHLRLASPAGDARLGGLFGDYVKGDMTGRFPRAIEIEARLHRRIDSITDAHDFVREVKRVFPREQRRFAGIALDIYWDHLLLANWDALGGEPFEVFEEQTYAAMREGRALAPEPLRSMTPRMIEARFLRACATMAGVERAVLRVAAGWAYGDRLALCAATLRELPGWVGEGFADFYRDVAAQVARERAEMDAA
jgi:acyl carrier protein phosphodiesterase